MPLGNLINQSGIDCWISFSSSAFICFICSNWLFNAAIYSSLFVASNSEIGVSPKNNISFLTCWIDCDLACLVSSSFFFASFCFWISSLISFNWFLRAIISLFESISFIATTGSWPSFFNSLTSSSLANLISFSIFFFSSSILFFSSLIFFY